MATAFAIIQFGGTIPVPLYTLWRSQFPFSNGTLTVIFAIYAVGTLLALFLLAPLSDQLGRRPLLFGALALAALSTGLFLAAKSVDLLMAARFISGVATGCATATATAALRELQPHPRARLAALTATAANIGGLGLGALVAGFLAEYVGHPTTLVFWIYLALLVAGTGCVIYSSETVSRQDRISWRPRGLALPDRHRDAFAIAAGSTFAVFSLVGLFSSLVPSFLGSSLHEHSLSVAGAITAAIFLVATAAQLAFHGIPPSRALVVGPAGLLLSLGLIELAFWEGNLALMLIGTLVGGLAVGFTMMGSIATVNLISSPQQRAQVMATYFMCAYAGLTLPAVAVGIATDSVSVPDATLVCAIAIGAITVAAMLAALRANRTSVAASPDGPGSA